MSSLRTSSAALALTYMGEVFLYHQSFGYILKMSPDVYELWAAFSDGAERSFVEQNFRNRLEGQEPSELIDIFVDFDCLLTASLTAQEQREKLEDFVPVKGSWNIWRRIGSPDGECVELWTAWGDRPALAHRLSPADTAIWNAIDGERRVGELGAEHGLDQVLKLIAKLVSIEIQAIKMSPMPLSVYGGRHRWPAYLTSTMPYPPLDLNLGVAGVAKTPSMTAYHHDIADSDEQFDHVETTLAHLLRKPHPALKGRTFGAALITGLETHGLSFSPMPKKAIRIIEVGGGLGEVAASVMDALSTRGFTVDYTILEISPQLAMAQRERTGGRARIIEGDALAAELDDGCADLVIANEMVGDLETTALVDATELIEKYSIEHDGAPEDAVVNSGAFRLVERIAGWLAPAGLAVITEFGEKHMWPRLSDHLDHPEYSIHFGHLESVALAAGLTVEYQYLMDVIELDRECKGLATTRSQFRALAAMLSNVGITLDKVGYTEAMFSELLSTTETTELALAEIGDIRFDRIEDRLMGLVPHEFKALIMQKPPISGGSNNSQMVRLDPVPGQQT